MNDLQIFNNPEFGRVRSIIIDDDVWFVGRDVADALGYVNTKDAIIRHVDEDDIRVGIPDPIQKEISQAAKLINEAGVISLALMSELPSAKKFRRWITKEVIPSIIKTGSYTLPQLTPNEMILKIAQSNVELEKRVNTIEQKLDTAVKIFAASDKSWRDKMELAIKDIMDSGGIKGDAFRTRLYNELDVTANAKLRDRLERRRTRMKKNGATNTECKSVTKLDIISYDKRLRPIFEGIIKKYQAIYATQQISCLEEGSVAI